MPHGASPVMSAPTINLMPHVMDQDDIDAFVREYAASARLSLEGRADGVELHLNHDDMHEWFLSPFTNQRTDRYGGSLENRCRFAVETLQAIRDEVGSAHDGRDPAQHPRGGARRLRRRRRRRARAVPRVHRA